MKFQAKTVVVVDRKKPAIQPGDIIDLPKAEGEALKARGAVVEYAPPSAVKVDTNPEGDGQPPNPNAPGTGSNSNNN